MTSPCFTHQAAFYGSCGQRTNIKKSEGWPNHSGFPEASEGAKMRASPSEIFIVIIIIIIIIIINGSLRLCLVLLSTQVTSHWTKHLLGGYGTVF